MDVLKGQKKTKEGPEIHSLINWKEVSRRLSGNDNSIRAKKRPKKYEKKVNRLLKVIELWCSWTNRA